MRKQKPTCDNRKDSNPGENDNDDSTPGEYFRAHDFDEPCEHNLRVSWLPIQISALAPVFQGLGVRTRDEFRHCHGLWHGFVVYADEPKVLPAHLALRLA